MKIEAEIRLRNAVLRQRRVALGLTQKQLGDLIGVTAHTICQIETMRGSGSREVLERLAEVLGCTADDLHIKWPKEVPTIGTVVKDIEPHALEAYMDVVRCRALEMAKDPAVTAGAAEEYIDRKNQISKALDTLTFREREVIKMRYGIGTDDIAYTFEEIGRKFKVTRECVRQIEARALRKLQHPVRMRIVADVAPFPEED